MSEVNQGPEEVTEDVQTTESGYVLPSAERIKATCVSFDAQASQDLSTAALVLADVTTVILNQTRGKREAAVATLFGQYREERPRKTHFDAYKVTNVYRGNIKALAERIGWGVKMTDAVKDSETFYALKQVGVVKGGKGKTRSKGIPAKPVTGMLNITVDAKDGRPADAKIGALLPSEGEDSPQEILASLVASLKAPEIVATIGQEAIDNMVRIAHLGAHNVQKAIVADA